MILEDPSAMLDRIASLDIEEGGRICIAQPTRRQLDNGELVGKRVARSMDKIKMCRA